jgi:hypothetical protein
MSRFSTKRGTESSRAFAQASTSGSRPSRYNPPSNVVHLTLESEREMAAHVNPHTLASLRLTLQNLEQSSEPGRPPTDLAALTHILISRIAELECTPALDVSPSDPAPSQKERDQL